MMICLINQTSVVRALFAVKLVFEPSPRVNVTEPERATLAMRAWRTKKFR